MGHLLPDKQLAWLPMVAVLHQAPKREREGREKERVEKNRRGRERAQSNRLKGKSKKWAEREKVDEQSMRVRAHEEAWVEGALSKWQCERKCESVWVRANAGV